jgi:hypothetical protein
MLRGYRRVLFALVGFVALVGIAIPLVIPPPFLPRYEQKQGPGPSYRPGGSECDPARLKGLSGGNAANEREDCEEAAEEHRLKQNDLVQQARSANAAEAITRLAYQQTLLLFLGTVVGFLTMGAAVYAAWFAKRAAEAAEKDLSHGLHAARAYLALDRDTASFDKASKTLTVQFVLKNVGTTPADKLLGTITNTFKYHSGEVVSLRVVPWTNGTTTPGLPVNLDYEMVLEEAEAQAFLTDKGQVWIEFVASYSNAFGEDWIYDHLLNVDARGLKSGTVWTIDCKQFRKPANGEKAKHQPALNLEGGG